MQNKFVIFGNVQSDMYGKYHTYGVMSIENWLIAKNLPNLTEYCFVLELEFAYELLSVLNTKY